MPLPIEKGILFLAKWLTFYWHNVLFLWLKQRQVDLLGGKLTQAKARKNIKNALHTYPNPHILVQYLFYCIFLTAVPIKSPEDYPSTPLLVSFLSLYLSHFSAYFHRNITIVLLYYEPGDAASRRPPGS
jgi:hypothetical protein